MLECNYSLDCLIENGENTPELHDRILNSHMGLHTVLDYLKTCDLTDVQKIYLIHMSRSNIDIKKTQQIVEGLTGIPTYTA